jgi:hypothetical protein
MHWYYYCIIIVVVVALLIASFYWTEQNQQHTLCIGETPSDRPAGPAFRGINCDDFSAVFPLLFVFSYSLVFSIIIMHNNNNA